MEDSERRKAIELLKEMRSGNREDDGKTGNQETRLNWMYKGPADLVDKEEYLLGKAIDKTFDLLNSGGNSDIIGRTAEQSNVPKRLLERTESTEQVDIAKKILEDPLYAIKQKEMEARKKLLNNPVKLKQIRQMLLERSKQNSSHNRKKKKKKSEQDLNLLIIKKLKKFTDKEKRKALNKIMESESSSSSSVSSSQKDKKHKSKRKKLSSSISSSDSSSCSSEESEKERKSKKKKRQKKTEKFSSDSDREKSRKMKKKQEKSSSSLSESESLQERSRRSKVRPENDRRRIGNKNPDKVRKWEGSRRDNSDDERRSRKSYGLMKPDGSKPETMKRTSPIRKYSRNVETKAKYVPPRKPKPLSEKERNMALKEMMKDAKLRKEDREKNLANYRRKEALEEESKTYDDDFVRRQMSHLTSQGTVADRIKSNINNIQRSKSSMNTNFMRK